MIYSKTEHKLVEKAITFFVTEYNKSGFNPKPVIFHSLRVACRLAETGSPAVTIAAAVLHDILEDTKVTPNKLKQNFNRPIVRLVRAVTFNTAIKNKTRRYQESFRRTNAAGSEALLIKCADILDNSAYYSFGNNYEAELLLMEKLRYFLTIAKPKIGRHPLFLELTKSNRALTKQMKRAWL